MTRFYTKDYIVQEKTITATAIDINLFFDDACASFMSCFKSAIFQTLEATKNIIGFYKFFGEGGVSQVNEDDPTDKSCKVISSGCFFL